MISGASKLANRTSTDTSCEFCKQTTTTSAIRIPVIQRRQLVCFFSCGPTVQILDGHRVAVGGQIPSVTSFVYPAHADPSGYGRSSNPRKSTAGALARRTLPRGDLLGGPA